MSVGATCLTSSSSNDGCQVVLAIFLVNPFFFPEKGFFPHTRAPPPKKSACHLRLNYFFWVGKNATYGKKKKCMRRT